ncbi:MAG: hypothetical protein IID14_08900 [Candidatus Marinimicrobia bacterium]|nr:hypothetical protein [Candidatus Neomarinimicrobiota bacterium]
MKTFGYYLDGASTLLDIGVPFTSIPGGANLAEEDIGYYHDYLALSNDWKIVGNDLWQAIDEYKEEFKTEQIGFQFADSRY